jgi:putative FmdB family regulatory protein
MPTYLYVCETNKHPHEIIHGMNEKPDQRICGKPDCGGKLIRKFTAPTINFKGTGFNATKG